MGRSRSVSWLRGAFVLAPRVAPALFVAACASAPPPAPLTEADNLLGRKDAGDIAIARPELVEEARDVLRRAQTAHNMGEDERATLLAHQAIQLFTSAKNLVERSEAERLLRLVDKAAGETEEEKKKAALEAKLKTLEEQSKSSPEAARAMAAIDRARDKQSAALEKGAVAGSAGVYFQQGQKMLEVAVDAFEKKSYAQSTNAGQSAAASFSSAIGAFEFEKDKGRDEKVAEAAKPGKPAAAEPASVPGGSGGVSAAPSAAAGVTPATALTFKQLADKMIIELELRRAEALGDLKDQRCPGPFREISAMLELAQKRFGAGDYEHAYEYALRADERFRACEKFTASAPVSTAPASSAAASAAQANARRSEETDEAARKKALVAVQKAQIESARAQAANPTDPGVVQGNLLLSNADTWLGKKSYAEAEDFANQALAVLSKVKAPAQPEAAPPKPAAPAQAPIVLTAPAPAAAPPPTSIVVQAPPVAPAPPGTTVRIVDERSAAREEQFLETRIAQMQQALAKLEQQQQQAPVDAAWRPAYEKIFRTLSLRDRARLRSPDAKKNLDAAEDLIQQARTAWQGKRYADATRLADEASALLAPLAEATAESGTPTEIEARVRKADEQIREASVGQQVCEKEACGDRDLAGYARAKETLASARQAYVDKRYSYASELADKAKQGFAATLLKPKKGAPDPKIESEKLEALKQEADTTLREANISKKICDTKACRATDGEGWIRATEYMASAQAAYVDKRYEVAKELADKADKIFKYAIAMQPEFMLPPSVTKVTRSGSQLRLNPPVKFSKGTTLAPQSEASITELAKVLIENKAALKKVSLIGYTDNRGLAATNKKLSADRAAVLREALIKQGVSADLLVAEGRGGDSPVGDNATVQGREDNRRIEIVMDLVEGAK